MSTPFTVLDSVRSKKPQSQIWSPCQFSGKALCEYATFQDIIPRLNINSYSTIGRLIDDTNPCNTFRQSVYASTTGGGTGSKPLFFATDVHENRRARAGFGRFIQNIGVIKNSDWVVTTHTAGELYR